MYNFFFSMYVICLRIYVLGWTRFGKTSNASPGIQKSNLRPKLGPMRWQFTLHDIRILNLLYINKISVSHFYPSCACIILFYHSNMTSLALSMQFICKAQKNGGLIWDPNPRSRVREMKLHAGSLYFKTEAGSRNLQTGPIRYKPNNIWARPKCWAKFFEKRCCDAWWHIVRFLSTFLGILENEFQWPRFTVYIINKSGGLIFYEVRISFTFQWKSFSVKTFSEKIKKEKFSFCCNYSELEGKLVAPVRFFLRKDISLQMEFSSENFCGRCFLGKQMVVWRCVWMLRIMDRPYGWTRMTACDRRVYGIRCMRFLSIIAD